MGTEVELIRAFGKKPDYLRAVHELQAALYAESA
jgi:type I restriction enzyme R subunit